MNIWTVFAKTSCSGLKWKAVDDEYLHPQDP